MKPLLHKPSSGGIRYLKYLLSNAIKIINYNLTDILQNKESYSSYIASELQALEREQKCIDEKATALEKQLRRVMDRADNSEVSE